MVDRLRHPRRLVTLLACVASVPSQPSALVASNAQEDALRLVWGPPHRLNGHLTGYLLQWQHSTFRTPRAPAVSLTVFTFSLTYVEELRQGGWGGVRWGSESWSREGSENSENGADGKAAEFHFKSNHPKSHMMRKFTYQCVKMRMIIIHERV